MSRTRYTVLSQDLSGARCTRFTASVEVLIGSHNVVYHVGLNAPPESHTRQVLYLAVPASKHHVHAWCSENGINPITCEDDYLRPAGERGWKQVKRFDDKRVYINFAFPYGFDINFQEVDSDNEEVHVWTKSNVLHK